MYGTNARQLREELTHAAASAPDPATAGWAGLALRTGDDHCGTARGTRSADPALPVCRSVVVSSRSRGGGPASWSREFAFARARGGTAIPADRESNMSSAGMPSLDELSTPQDFAMVETWRQVARAAAFGEHDFPALMDQGRLSHAERLDRPPGRGRGDPGLGRPRQAVRQHPRLGPHSGSGPASIAQPGSAGSTPGKLSRTTRSTRRAGARHRRRSRVDRCPASPAHSRPSTTCSCTSAGSRPRSTSGG